MKYWKKISSKYVHENPWYRVRQDQVIMPNGKSGVYNVVETRGAVYIVALNDEQEVALIKQERYTTGIESYEAPAGGIEEGEDPLETAKRELIEETGYAAKEWKKLSETQAANGISNAVCYVFLAATLEKAGFDEKVEEGITDVKFVSFDEINHMIKSGELSDSPTIAAIYRAKLALED